MASREYDAYLNSPVWKAQRARQLSRDGYRCRNCHAQTKLQVHHFYYTRDGVSILGKETPDDLITLCETCHVALTRCRQPVFGTGPRRRWLLWLFVLIVGTIGLWVGMR